MRHLPLTLLPLVFAACTEWEAAAPEMDAALTFAATHVTENSFDFHWVRTYYLPCAGEEVFAEGDIHFLVTQTITPSGNYVATVMGQPMGLKGVGLTSGLDYKFAGVTRESFVVQGDGFPLTDTFVNRLNIIGPSGIRAATHDTYKITINGIGDLAVEHQTSTVECR